MGFLKGQTEARRWEEGKKLTRKDAILAQCYICNGREDSRSRDIVYPFKTTVPGFSGARGRIDG